MERFTDDDREVFTITLKTREDAKIYLHAPEMIFALSEMKEYLRKHRKYYDEKSGMDYKTIEMIEDEFLSIVQSNNVYQFI